MKIFPSSTYSYNLSEHHKAPNQKKKGKHVANSAKVKKEGPGGVCFQFSFNCCG
jgi:hypothetical protein